MAAPEEELEIFPPGAPLQTYIAKAYLELWEDARNLSPMFPTAVEIFVAMIPPQIADKIKFDYEGEEYTANEAIKKLEMMAKSSSSFERGRIRRGDEFMEDFKFALRLFNAALECLFNEKLLVPARRKPPHRKMMA